MKYEIEGVCYSNFKDYAIHIGCNIFIIGCILVIVSVIVIAVCYELSTDQVVTPPHHHRGLAQ